MRKLFLLILLLALSGNITNIFPWDSTAAKYFPLKVGNKWIYRGTSTAYVAFGRSYQTYTVVGIKDTLGRKYYEIAFRMYMISGTISSGVMQFDRYVRIDSASMNICKLQSYCNRNEWLLDSLRAKKNDSLKICTFEFYTASSVCTDTSNYTIFYSSYPSKTYAEFFGPGYGTIFVKGIGIVYSSYGYQMNQTHDTLKGCIINGMVYGDTSIIVGINQISSEIPEQFSLSQNYPNPFNPTTKIKFSIPNAPLSFGEGLGVGLIIYDALGREVQTLVNEQLSPGTYEVEFPAPTRDGSNFSSGVYYYTLSYGYFSQTKKMVLIK